MTKRGADYIANGELSALDGTVLAAAGETCERVPVSSLGWLEEQGLVTRQADAPASPAEPEPADDSIDITFPADQEER